MFYYLSLGVTIASSILYHLFLKVTPAHVHPMFSLAVTYLVATILTLACYPFYPAAKEVSFLSNLKELNWASYALGIVIVGLEIGTLIAYRVGWNISLFNVIASTTVSILLIPIGLMYFKESISAINAAGLVLCLIGLVLVNYKG